MTVRIDGTPSFGRLLVSEVRKLVTLPAVWGSLAAGVLVAGGAAWLFSATYRADPTGGRDLLDVALGAIDYVQAGFLVLGVLAISSEYPGPIRVTLTTTPRRIPVHLAKATALAMCALPVALVAVATVFAVSRALLGGEVDVPALGTTLGQLASATAYLVIVALLAFAVATGLRRTVPAVSAALGYFFVLGPLIRRYTGLDWTPDTAGIALWHPGSAPPGLEGPAGWAVLTAWTLGLLAIATTAFTLRDT
ncbi:hypothetical protein [Streptomyces sp. NPDC058045]|uniref:hypothetical protein n=1 Tax=Streptomyces sp. NPDC058045 TaxID=3346311 RepID=UPI0036E1A920